MTVRSVFLMAALSTPGVAFAQNVVEVQVAPPSITLKVGEKSGLLATAFDRVGNVIPTVRIIWSSNNVAVAKVDNNGTVTAVAGGGAIIEARGGSRKGEAAGPGRGAPAGSAGGPTPGPPSAPAPPAPDPRGAGPPAAP